MIRFVLLGVLLIAFVWLVRSFLPAPKSPTPDDPEEMVQDANNGTYIPKSQAIHKVIDGESYYFSSEASAREFEQKSRTPDSH